MKTPKKVLKQLKEEKKSKAAASQDFPENGSSMMPPELREQDTIEMADKFVKDGNISKTKNYADYAKWGNNALGEFWNKGSYEAFLSLAKDKSGFSGAQDAFSDVKNIKKPDKGLVKAGKGLSAANKALQVATTAEDAYLLHDAMHKKDAGKTAKSGMDLLSELSQWAPHPAIKAFGISYETMTMIDESTDHAVSDFTYDMIFNDFGGLEDTQNKILEAKSKGKQLQLKTLNTIDGRCKKLLKSVNSNKAIIDQTTLEYALAKTVEVQTTTPYFGEELPSLEPMDRSSGDLDTLIDDLINLEIRLEAFIIKQEAFILSTQEKVENLTKGRKEKQFGISLIPTKNNNEKEFKRYNGRGDLIEAGKVSINKKGIINGGNGLKYYKYDKSGALVEEGTFDFDGKGKKINEKSNKLIIY